MGKICTTVEQSRKLIELGMDVNTSDMEYVFGKEIPTISVGAWLVDRDTVPAWSLSKLLELMPKRFSEKADERSSYFWSLEWQLGNDKSIRYIALGGNRRIRVEFYERSYERKDEVDIAVKMVCWLLENKKL